MRLHAERVAQRSKGRTDRSLARGDLKRRAHLSYILILATTVVLGLGTTAADARLADDPTTTDSLSDPTTTTQTSVDATSSTESTAGDTSSTEVTPGVTTSTEVTPGATTSTVTTIASSDTAARQGLTVTADAGDVDSYQLSLLGNSLDFVLDSSNAWCRSETPLSIVNNGVRPFEVYISADAPPSNSIGGYPLTFSESPDADQVHWVLSSRPEVEGATSVSDTYAADLGEIAPGGSLTLYSFLSIGSGLTYPGTYTWNATVYAVPVAG
jgi:hypothetical protein